MSRQCVKQELDRLLDWYDRYRPGQVTAVRVNACRRTLQLFCHWEARHPQKGLYYRGRRIVYREST